MHAADAAAEAAGIRLGLHGVAQLQTLAALFAHFTPAQRAALGGMLIADVATPAGIGAMLDAAPAPPPDSDSDDGGGHTSASEPSRQHPRRRPQQIADSPAGADAST